MRLEPPITATAWWPRAQGAVEVVAAPTAGSELSGLPRVGRALLEIVTAVAQARDHGPAGVSRWGLAAIAAAHLDEAGRYGPVEHVEVLAHELLARRRPVAPAVCSVRFWAGPGAEPVVAFITDDGRMLAPSAG